MKKIEGTIRSEKGFYVGDICYALNEQVYDDVWGGAGYKDGIHEVPGTGHKFAVAGTAYGDGTYIDDAGREYGVDAGNIGLVAGEIVEDTQGGHYFEGPGEATYSAENGFFCITLPDGKTICINTAYEPEEDYDDGYYEEDDDDDDYDDYE